MKGAQNRIKANSRCEISQMIDKSGRQDFLREVAEKNDKNLAKRGGGRGVYDRRVAGETGDTGKVP